MSANDNVPRAKSRSCLYASAVTLIVAGLIGLAGAGLFVWSGLFDVSATSGHSQLTAAVLHYAMQRSVAFHARRDAPPLDDPNLALRGATHFNTECAPCHGAPGVTPSAVERNATPPPPPLTDVAQRYSPSELHWIVKHGVKMTAMPPWPAQQRDDEVWALVAFLERLPALDPKAYARLAKGSPTESEPPQPKAGVAALPAPSATVPATCASCHGVDGHGRNGAFPNIAGLDRTYMRGMLEAFADGTRPSGFMQAVAARLSPAEREQAVDYFSRLARRSEANSPDGVDQKHGESIARFGAAGMPACVSCHAADGASRSPGVPTLAAQPYDYLVRQMQLFRSGVRSDSRNAAIMRHVSHRLGDEEIASVSAYFAALEPQ